jgi:tetratricopeptide (TPR) repeat protein
VLTLNVLRIFSAARASHTIRGTVPSPVHHRWYRLDLAAAAQRVEHAYLQDRANPDVVGVAADLARPLGRFDQAIEYAQYRLQLDPLDAVAYEDLAYAYPYAGKLDEALDALRTVLRLSPHYFMAHEGIGELLLQKGDAEAALAEMQLEESEPARLLGSSMALHALDVLNLRTSA